MPLNVIKGDILQMEVDAIVISANPSVCVGGELGKKVYEAAGKEELLEARSKLGRIKKGTSGITPGYNLGAKYVIHTVVPRWHGGCKKEDEYIRSCYRSALKLATEAKVHSVAIPLLGSGLNYFPYDKAYQIAREAIEVWLNANKVELLVYLVIKKDKPVAVKENVNKERFKQYLYTYIPKNKQFAELISCDPATIGRLKKDEFKSNRKELILSVMLGLIETGLPQELRFDFMASAGYSYPVDNRDKTIEALLETGERKFIIINRELGIIDPEWVLCRKTRDN